MENSTLSPKLIGKDTLIGTKPVFFGNCFSVKFKKRVPPKLSLQISNNFNDMRKERKILTPIFIWRQMILVRNHLLFKGKTS